MRLTALRRAGRALLLAVCTVSSLWGLNGCAAATLLDVVQARAQSRTQFIPLADAPLVHYYPDTAAMRETAQRVAAGLAESAGTVEQLHGAAFMKPPRIYVCDPHCFTRYTTMGASVPAGHFMDSVFMNQPALAKKEAAYGVRPEDFLTHELTHLLLYQHAGGAAYMRVPAWFREGLAVAFSGGAGAEACSPEQAAVQLLAGNAFDPDEAGSLFDNRTSASYGLPYPVFYRQAGMFVDYLRARDVSAFQAALNSVMEGGDFQRSFREAYGRPIASFWPEFRKSLRRKDSSR